MVLSLPSIYVKGTHYEVGFTIGRTFRDRIFDFWKGSSYLETELVPFYLTERGRSIYEGYLQAANEHYPHYVEELKGLAEGVQIPFYKMFLLQLNMEYRAILGSGEQHECSTISVLRDDICMMGHNEDTNPLAKTCGYIVKAVIEDSSFPDVERKKMRESFTAYSYPGFLPGRAMGFNDNGLVFAMNALYPVGTPLNKTPRAFLNRALLSAESFDDALAILLDEGLGVATGFSANIGVFLNGKREIRNFEVSPPLDGDCVSRVTEVRIGSSAVSYLCHFNDFEHSPDVEEDASTQASSIHRRRAAEKLTSLLEAKEQASVKAGILDILGNDDDQEYPIFRTPRPTDPGMTVATGIFDFSAGTWEIYLENPKTSEGPLLAFRMK